MPDRERVFCAVNCAQEKDSPVRGGFLNYVNQIYIEGFSEEEIKQIKQEKGDKRCARPHGAFDLEFLTHVALIK